ncbi:MAG: NAD-dependent epimerase/dehydratase family protein [Verrucomicrobiales bacterium]|nr:NAD-dependent epimerase/dehydratase family protein [Verrucomicrobiales bacterium]
MEKHILIIGHGYVGSELARQLHASGAIVTAINRSVDAEADYTLLEGDVSDAESIASLKDKLITPPGVIVHCASSGRGGADAYRAVFIEGTKNLHATFPDVPILFTSSTSVYGQTDGSVVTESSATEPDRETSRLLIEAEKLICSGGGIALRLAGIYGPGRSVYLKRILNGTAEIEAGEVSRCVNQIHCDDAAGAIIHLMNHPQAAGQVYNVSDNEPLSQRKCFEQLAEFFDVPSPPEAPPNKDRKRAWTHKVISNEKLKATGWRPEYPSFVGALTKDERLVESMRSKG